MAVQKSKVTRSRRGQRRSHDSLSTNTMAQDPMTGEVHFRHHMTRDGVFKGRQVINNEQDDEQDQEWVGTRTRSKIF